MKGILFGDLEVKVDPAIRGIGGSFPRVGRDGTAHAYDPGLVKFVYGLLVQLESPVLADIGANTGSFTLLAKFVPGLRVVAFEPNPQVFKVLESHVRLNGIEELVELHNVALMDKAGTGSLRVPKKHGLSGHGTLGDAPALPSQSPVEVKVDTLDRVFRGGRLDVIKLDVEGAELFTIQGGRETIQRFKPQIVYEQNEKAARQFGYGVREVRSLLEEMGYRDFEDVGHEDVWARV